jgi:hypothetical protein
MSLLLSKNKITFGILLCLFGISLFLRLYKSSDGLIFGYDQARDFFRARAIAQNHDLKLIGPETDIPGVHHGVGYYYFLALPLILSGSPVNAIRFLALIHSLGIFLIYFAAKYIFQKKSTALISTFLFTFSFEMIQYGRWLSNPTMAVFTTLITYLGIYLWIKNKAWGLSLALFGAGLSIHFQLFLVYLFILPVAAYLIYKPKINMKSLVLGFVTVLFFLAPFVVAEFKFNFQAIKAIGRYLSNQSGEYVPVSGFILRFLDRFSSLVFHTFLPVNPILALGLFVFLVWIVLHNQKGSERKIFNFLIFWFMSTIPIFIFSSGALNAEFSLVAMAVCAIMIGAFSINYMLQSEKLFIWAIVILILFTITNIRFTLNHAEDGAFIFSIQGPNTYGLEQKVIDYTYKEAHGKPFSICTVTNPLFINTTWAYLYETYGKSKYGYLPFYTGSDQTGVLGNLPTTKEKTDIRYLIFEPPTGIPLHVGELYTNLEEYISDVTDAQNFGEFKVEKRKFLTKEEMEVKKLKYSVDYNKANNEANLDLYKCYN